MNIIQDDIGPQQTKVKNILNALLFHLYSRKHLTNLSKN